ncbi:MAG TPA: DinB family protein, partial [Bryobacteraceae bacterium]|nr:DinB family protein [Bryobacteraceae bacterium]
MARVQWAYMVRVESVLGSWKTIRQDTAQAVEDCPAGALDFRPAPELMSFRESALHILDAGNALSGLLLACETNMTAPDFREKMKAYRSALPADAGASALAAELREAVNRRTSEFAQQTPEFFSQLITRFDGQQVTRLEMVQTIKEHELTHRQHLF